MSSEFKEVKLFGSPRCNLGESPRWADLFCEILHGQFGLDLDSTENSLNDFHSVEIF